MSARHPSAAPASAQSDGLRTGPFVTSLIELKFDQATAFEWQRHIQGTSVVPHHGELLKFLDLQAQASQSTTSEGQMCTMKRSAQSVRYIGNVLQKPEFFLPTQLVHAPYAVGQSILYTHAENLNCCHMTSALQQ